MPRRLYLATRKDRGEQTAALLQALMSQGWERTYSWAAGDEETVGQYSDIALRELKGVEEADVLIVLLPGGYGTHVEIGAALALGKPVILHAPNRKTLETPYPCPFHYHPNVRLLVSEEIDIAALLKCLPS
jgi:nucleoside 2-deoxyribosyltransferase